MLRVGLLVAFVTCVACSRAPSSGVAGAGDALSEQAPVSPPDCGEVPFASEAPHLPTSAGTRPTRYAVVSSADREAIGRLPASRARSLAIATTVDAVGMNISTRIPLACVPHPSGDDFVLSPEEQALALRTITVDADLFGIEDPTRVVPEPVALGHGFRLTQTVEGATVATITVHRGKYTPAGADARFLYVIGHLWPALQAPPARAPDVRALEAPVLGKPYVIPGAHIMYPCDPPYAGYQCPPQPPPLPDTHGTVTAEMLRVDPELALVLRGATLEVRRVFVVSLAAGSFLPGIALPVVRDATSNDNLSALPLRTLTGKGFVSTLSL